MGGVQLLQNNFYINLTHILLYISPFRINIHNNFLLNYTAALLNQQFLACISLKKNIRDMTNASAVLSTRLLLVSNFENNVENIFFIYKICKIMDTG